MTEPASLQALLRVPLTQKRARMLERLIDQFPNYWLDRRGPFLEFHAEDGDA